MIRFTLFILEKSACYVEAPPAKTAKSKFWTQNTAPDLPGIHTWDRPRHYAPQHCEPHLYILGTLVTG